MKATFSTDKIKTLSVLPGVYIMKDSLGEVIYVGKAKSLRARVRSYFSGTDTRQSVQFLIEKLTDIETVVTQDERQALILEGDLIRKFKPRYNIKLKDDRAHLLARVDLNQKWPKIDLVRREYNDGAKYIGPFVYSYELRALLDFVKNTVPLRTCSDRVLMNRVRPCMEYQIKRCAGPCCFDIDRNEYLSWVERAIEILQGKDTDILSELELAMARASENLRYEEAARLRDQIAVVKESMDNRANYSFSAGSKDAIGVHRDQTKAEVSVIQVRQGRLINAQTFGFEDLAITEDELLSSFLSQYYKDDIPSAILLPTPIEDSELREELYSEIKGQRVHITIPERGEKQRLVLLAQENARENFIARFSGSVEDSDRALRGIKEELGIEQMPRTIECVDISHFQGGSTVGSVVHFKDGRPEKSRYRHFTIASQEGKPDDFASMLEVVKRHLSRGLEENSLPDLLVIDGGKAQLAMAVAARKDLGLSEPRLVGLAKRRNIRSSYLALGGGQGRMQYKPERIYVEGKSGPIVLRESSKALKLLERLRDEAHRFAITFHRASRAKRAFTSKLDQVPGLGERRKMALLREFGSVKRIEESTVEELKNRAGIPLKIGERVLKLLQMQSEEE